MDVQRKAALTHEEMVELWTGLRTQVDEEPGGLAENIRSGGCGENYDFVWTQSGHRAEFCDLWAFANEDGTEWDFEKLAANPKVQPPPGLDWDMLRDMGFIKQSHVWATLEGRHYDIEANEGVGNPFDLNDIRCGLVRELSACRPELFTTLSGDPWWQEAIAVKIRTDEAVASLESPSPRP